MKVDSCVRPTPERTTIWLPSYGRHTAVVTPTGRRILTAMGGQVVRDV